MVDRACLEGAVGRHASTVPSWNCEPDPAAGAERTPGLVGLLAVMEEAVHDGPGSADVGPEGAEAGELLGVRRRREVVRREGGQVARAADLLERVLERGAAVFVALLCSARIESGVDRRGRVLARPLRQQQDDPVVLRQVELLELRARAAGKLGACRQEERNVGAETGGELMEPFRGERLVECL